MLTLKLDLIPLPLNLVNICKLQGGEKRIQISKRVNVRYSGITFSVFCELINSLFVDLSEQTFGD